MKSPAARLLAARLLAAGLLAAPIAAPIAVGAALFVPGPAHAASDGFLSFRAAPESTAAPVRFDGQRGVRGGIGPGIGAGRGEEDLYRTRPTGAFFSSGARTRSGPARGVFSNFGLPPIAPVEDAAPGEEAAPSSLRPAPPGPLPKPVR